MALIINGEQVDDEVIEGEFRSVKGHYERLLQVSCCERDPEFLGHAKDNLISRVLLNQESQRRFPEVPEAAVTERLQRLIDEAGGEHQFYLNIGMPYKDEALVRTNVAGGVRLDLMLGEIYGPEPEFSEAELRAAYAERQELYLTEEMIRVAHITKSLQGAGSRDEVYQAMRVLRRQLLAGADFLQTAEAERADDQQQIDLGWFKRGEFMEEFEVIAFSMDEGEISPVFTTQLGFHLCTVLGRRPPEPLPFEAVRDAVRQRLTEADKDRKFNALIETLKASATIEDTDPPDGDRGCGH